MNESYKQLHQRLEDIKQKHEEQLVSVEKLLAVALYMKKKVQT
jgi:hypothetical protein